MKIIQLTLHIDTEEAESIITFLDELRAILVAHYGEEIRQSHRIRLKLDSAQGEQDDF